MIALALSPLGANAEKTSMSDGAPDEPLSADTRAT